MAPITKLLRKTEVFEWIIECQTGWEDIKNQYIQASIFISGRSEFNSYIIITYLHYNMHTFTISTLIINTLDSAIH